MADELQQQKITAESRNAAAEDTQNNEPGSRAFADSGDKTAFLPAPTVAELKTELVDNKIISESQWQEALTAAGAGAEADAVLHQLQKATAPLRSGLGVAIQPLTAFQISRIRGRETAKLRFSHYLILEPLGAGGMGEVYKVINLNVARIEALKMIKLRESHSSSATNASDRFLREARILASLTHPAITMLFHAGFEENTAFITMEFIEGATLEKHVKQLRSAGQWPDVEWAARAMLALAEALRYAHQSQVVHRDIKPSNVMIAKGGQVKLLDLGVARLVSQKRAGASPSGDDTFTKPGDRLGTPAYMPPEQWSDASEVTAAGDIYSLGCTFFYALAGRPPFGPDESGSFFSAHLFQEPPRISELRPGVPKTLDRVLAKMLAKRPQDRYANVDELIKVLEPFASSADHTAPTLPLPPPGPDRTGLRNWVLATATVILLMGILTVLGMGMIRDILGTADRPKGKTGIADAELPKPSPAQPVEDAKANAKAESSVVSPPVVQKSESKPEKASLPVDPPAKVARVAFAAGRYVEAINALKDSPDLPPRDRALLADAYRRNRDFADAERQYQLLIGASESLKQEHLPALDELYVDWGDTRVEEGDFVTAFEQYRKTSPETAAQIQQHMKKVEEAIKQLAKVKERALSGKDEEVIGIFDDAIKAFEYVTRNAEFAAAVTQSCLRQATKVVAKADYDQAIALLERAAKASPDSPAVKQVLRDVHRLRGDQRVVLLNKYLDRQEEAGQAETPGSVEELGRLLRAVLEDFERAVAIDEKDVDSHWRIAHLLAMSHPRHRDAKRALHHAELARKLADAENTNYLQIYAAALAENERFPDAVAAQEKAIQLRPADTPATEAKWQELCLERYRAAKKCPWNEKPRTE